MQTYLYLDIDPQPMKQTEAVEWQSRLNGLLSDLIDQGPGAKTNLPELWLGVSKVLEPLSNKNFLPELNSILESQPPLSAAHFDYQPDGKEIRFWPSLIRALTWLRMDTAENAKREFNKCVKVAMTEQQRKWILKAMYLATFWNDAIQLAEAILSRDAKCYSTKITLARSLRIIGESEKSIRHWQELIEAIPNEFEFYGELGNTQFAAKLYEEAITSYEVVAQSNPNDIAAHLSIYAAYRELNATSEADAALQKAISIPGISDETYEQIVKGFLANEQPEQTLQIIERWLECSPGNAVATHHRNSCLAALNQNSTTETTSTEYLEKEFDGFARTFERQLKLLEYRGPAVIEEALVDHFGESQCEVALDAGCGTGWCGPAIRKHSKTLIGVDLSTSMLEKAKQKSVYDELLQGDLVKHLCDRPQQYDLVVSFDTLVYFGDLADAFNAAKTSLKSNGVFIFSLELLETDEPKPFALQLNGRYAHSVSHVQESLSTAGLEATYIERRVLRMEKSLPVYHILVNAKPVSEISLVGSLFDEPEPIDKSKNSELEKSEIENGESEAEAPNAMQPNRVGCEFRDRSLHDKVLIYQGLLGRQPDLGPAHFELGNAYLGLEEFDLAIECFLNAAKIAPDAGTYTNLGNAYAQSGNLKDASASFIKALELDSRFVPALNNLGRAEFELGNSDAAIQWLQQAIDVEPQNAKSHAFLANIHSANGEIDKAIVSYENSLEANAEQPEVLVLLGNALRQLNRFGAAAASYVKAQQLSPQNPVIYDLIGQVNWHRGQITEAGFCHLQALQLSAHDSKIHSNLLHSLMYDSTVELAGIQSEARIWQAKHPVSNLVSFDVAEIDKDPNRKLRIGYFSASYFGNLSVDEMDGANLLDFLKHHSNDSVETICYGLNLPRDLASHPISTVCDRWHVFDTDQATELIAEQIRKDEIDILVDLDGHQFGNGISVFVHRAAPVQISWLGYSGTTGLSEMDYIIADEFAVPKDESKFYTEQPILIPGGAFWGRFSNSNKSIKEAASPSSLPQQKKGYVTFGCLNPAACFSPDVIQVWAQILFGVPNSKLLLANQSCHDQTVQNRLIQSFAEFGIQEKQLKFSGVSKFEERKSLIEEMDVYLDTFPFAGGRQIWEVLSAGVPVVTKAGTGIRGRSSHSILCNLDLSELSVNKNELYIQLAMELANDIQRLALLKTDLHQKVTESSNCDPSSFTLKLEVAFRSAWRDFCEAN